MRTISKSERESLAIAISYYQKYKYLSLDSFLETSPYRAWIIGVTGAGGVGKSTLIRHLAEYFREQDLTVVVLAVDPSSEKDGWAFLADREKMRSPKLDTDEGFFFRSLASHGESSALSDAMPKIIKHSSKFADIDIVIVETAGAGQTDVEIHKYVDTLLQVLAPLGDIHTLKKAGQKEFSHIFAVNGRKEFSSNKKFYASASLIMGRETENGWQKKVFLIDAKEKKGINALIEGLYSHHEFLKNQPSR